MQSKKLSNNSLKSYQSVVIKLLELKREVRWIRDQKHLDMVWTVLFLENNLPELLSFFKRIQKNPYIMEQSHKIKKSYKHMTKISKRHWEINNIRKTVRGYWKCKTLLVPFKTTERSYQIKYTKRYLTTTMGWALFKIVIFWKWAERWPRTFSI